MSYYKPIYYIWVIIVSVCGVDNFNLDYNSMCLWGRLFANNKKMMNVKE